MQINKKVEEIMAFFEFSLREDASFSGAISFHLQTEANSTQSFTIRVCGENNSKRAIATYGIEQPTTVVTMSIDDFFLVYSGSVSAFELTRMFFQHRIVIENHDFSKVKSFASSFDYSTAKWNEFYSVMEKRKESWERCNRIFSLPFYQLDFLRVKSALTHPCLTFKFPLSTGGSLPLHLNMPFYHVSADYYKCPVPPFLWRVRNESFPSTLEKTQTKSARIRDDLLSEATYLEAQQLLRLHNEKKSLQKKQWYFREMAFLRPYTLSESVFQNSLFDVTNSETWYQMIHGVKGNLRVSNST